MTYYTIYQQKHKGEDYTWLPVDKLNQTIERTLANDVMRLREATNLHDWKIVWPSGDVVARKNNQS
jgi:hypothetical protein